jgi:hypothetical protein
MQQAIKGIESVDVGIGIIQAKINVPNILASIFKPGDKEDDSIGTVIKEFDKDDNFGIGTHSDCSEMTSPIINIEDGKTTACDFILRYTIRDENRTLSWNNWHQNSWKAVPGNKSVVSDPSAISNGPGKFEAGSQNGEKFLE